jgi:hypothetical protein
VSEHGLYVAYDLMSPTIAIQGGPIMSTGVERFHLDVRTGRRLGENPGLLLTALAFTPIKDPSIYTANYHVANLLNTSRCW